MRPKMVIVDLGSFIKPAFETEKTVNLLIYGNSGVGKTYLVATADESSWGHPALLIDVEAGKKTVQGKPIDVITIGDVAMSAHISPWAALRALVDTIMDGKLDKYKTFILDSLTETYQIALMDVVVGASAQKPGEVNPDLPQLQHYLEAGNRTKRILRDLRNLPKNVIFTALPMEIKDQRTFKTEVVPFLTDKLARQLPAYLDNVAYLYVVETDPEKPADPETNPQRRILMTSASGKYPCKSRGGKLGTYIENPDMDTVFGLVFDEPVPEPKPEV